MAEKRLSILVLAPGLPPNSMGGVEQHVRGLVAALSGRRRFRVITRDAAGRAPEEQGSVVRIPPGPQLGSVDERAADRDDAFEAVAQREIEEFAPDLIHLHHWLHLSNSLVGLFARAGKPVVVTLHDHYPICPRTDLLRCGQVACPGPEDGRACADCMPAPGAAFAGESEAHRVWRVMGSRVGFKGATRRWVLDRAHAIWRARLVHMRGELEQASALICPSESVKREMGLVWPEMEPRLSVLPHGIETAWGALVRREPSPRVRFAYVGTVNPAKGIEVLLEAFRKVDAGRAELTIYGGYLDPGFERRVRQAAEQVGVRVHGRYDREDLPAIYSQVDVAVAPSICKESASLAVREAFVGGAPVIASDLGALPEAVEDGGNGLLVRAGDPADLAEKMTAVVDDVALLARLRANLRLPKSVTEYAAEIEAIYDGLAAGPA